MTVMTGASGIWVILVQHRWKEDFLLRKEFEIPGVSMPNFELFFTLVSCESVKKHNTDFKKTKLFK